MLASYRQRVKTIPVLSTIPSPARPAAEITPPTVAAFQIGVDRVPAQILEGRRSDDFAQTVGGEDIPQY